jgi:outer membrane protein assembly factor BamB
LLAAEGDASERYWNQFRGPDGNGISQAQHLPVKFGEGSPEIMWKTRVPGRAWASPVIWGNQVWLANAPELQNPPNATLEEANPGLSPRLETPLPLSAVCLDLQSGKMVHDIHVFDVYHPQFTHPTNSYASCTPWIEEGRIYVHYGSYGTACLDTNTGEKLWERRDLECHHWRGPGASPVVHGELLYLCFDGHDQQYIVALDKETGSTVWKRDRGVDYGTDNGDYKKAYCTPSVIQVGGRELLISPFAMATIAYDPNTGEPVWTVYHGGMNAAARPLFGNGMVYINAGDGGNAFVAIRPDGHGDVTNTHVAWRQGRLIPKRPSQILLGELLFMMGDDGVATCRDALTGELVWRARVSGTYWASPIYAGGHLYAFSQDGKVAVLKAGREFKLVAENHLDEGCNASPAVADRSLIVRTMSHVYRIARRNPE